MHILSLFLLSATIASTYAAAVPKAAKLAKRWDPTRRCGSIWSDANTQCHQPCIDNSDCTELPGTTCFAKLDVTPCEPAWMDQWHGHDSGWHGDHGDQHDGVWRDGDGQREGDRDGDSSRQGNHDHDGNRDGDDNGRNGENSGDWHGNGDNRGDWHGNGNGAGGDGGHGGPFGGSVPLVTTQDGDHHEHNRNHHGDGGN